MRIQFLVQTLASAHQSLALVHCCNELVSKGHEVQVFVEDKGSPPIKPDFPIFDASYAYTQNNPLIVTSLSSLAVAINSPVSRKIWFYAWDMEWLSGEPFAWSSLQPMYTAVPLLARSEHHRRILQNTWGKYVETVIEDFSAEQIERLLCL
jgi:hypothetical protein